MSLDLYREKVEELVNNTTIKEQNIFDFEYSPFKDEFGDVFSFYQKNLVRNYRYGIEPSIIYFNNNKTINARAGRENNYFIISMNMATIVNLMTMFREKVDLLNDPIFHEIKNFEKLLDSSISELMYQNAIHFTFYHEMAHLIQKSDYLENYLYEHLDNSNEFSEARHLLELDADEYSSLCMGTHILQYSESIFGGEYTDENLENLLKMVCTSAFIYILSFPSNRRPLYYEKFSHPHPIIRVIWVVSTIIRYCINTLTLKGIETNLSTKKVLDSTLDFSELLSNQFFEGENLISKFRESLQNNGSDVMGYLAKYQKLKEGNKILAVYKWNQIASQLKDKRNQD